MLFKRESQPKIIKPPKQKYSGKAIIVASATHLFHLFSDLKDHFSNKIRDDRSGHFTSGLSLSVKGDLSIDHMGLSFT